MSTPFCEKVIALTDESLARLRTFTLSLQEFGGTMNPTNVDGMCCLEISTYIIKGTGAERVVGKDAANYSGRAAQAVFILSTPFGLKEIVRTVGMCFNPKERFNIIWHTHPVSVSKLSPPSMGDFAAHAVLGNLRNWGSNKTINTHVIVAFEGIYEYNITEEKFAEYVELVNTEMKGAPWHKRDLPTRLSDKLREELFNKLRDGYMGFEALCRRLREDDLFSTETAPDYGISKRKCRNVDECGITSLDFPYKKTLDSPDVVAAIAEFHDNNPYINALKANGFYYRYIPFSNHISLSVKVSSGTSHSVS